jgi:transcriptional regulator with XRE-family HTH domain
MQIDANAVHLIAVVAERPSRLRQTRLGLGLTLETVGRHLGVCRLRLGRAERGRINLTATETRALSAFYEAVEKASAQDRANAIWS